MTQVNETQVEGRVPLSARVGVGLVGAFAGISALVIFIATLIVALAALLAPWFLISEFLGATDVL